MSLDEYTQRSKIVMSYFSPTVYYDGCELFEAVKIVISKAISAFCAIKDRDTKGVIDELLSKFWKIPHDVVQPMTSPFSTRYLI